MRDDFNQSTKELLAKQAGHRCAHPHCGKPTAGANEDQTHFISIGVAAHITAASEGGPRFDPSLSPKQRKDATNGIWLCQDHARLVDADESGFRAEQLREWKRQAASRSFHALMAGSTGHASRTGFLLDPAGDLDVRDRFGLAADEDMIALKARLLDAARQDASAFRTSERWPDHAIDLNLRLRDGDDSGSFTAAELAATTGAFNEIAILSSPGTGKTTTLLQLAEAIITQRDAVACFIPLDEWSSQQGSLLESVLERQAFRRFNADHLRLLAYTGELTLVLDGWNQLDGESRKRARINLDSLRRDYPKLGTVASSRNIGVDIPYSATIVEIQPLNPGQQRRFAGAMRGTDGEALVEEARLIPELRELIAIPLFLTVLLRLAPGRSLPTTKEGLLSAFAQEHGRIADRNEALRRVTFGFEKDLLVGLAAKATYAANTAIADEAARAAIHETLDALVARHQLAAQSLPQPTIVLDALVADHLLIRLMASPPGYAFQHQQFQEWYASFEVERMMHGLARQDAEAAGRLSWDILDVRGWEEPILFACERLASGDSASIDAVCATILRCLSIDPMLAAEIIFRTPAAWPGVEPQVLEFFGNWHEPERVDRAIAFANTTGRPEFSEVLWSLLSDTDHHPYAEVLYAGRRFPPSLLPDLSDRWSALAEPVRATLLGILAGAGGAEGISVAASLAIAEPGARVKMAVLERLYFSGPEQQTIRVLESSPPEVWRQIATRYPLDRIRNPHLAERLAAERRAAYASLQEPGRKLHFLLGDGVAGIDVEPQIEALLADHGLDTRDDSVRTTLYRAHERYPSAVAAGLVSRIEQRLEIPFQAQLLLQERDVIVESDAVQRAVLEADLDIRIRTNAASVASSAVIGQLLDALHQLERQMAQRAPDARGANGEQWNNVRALILASPYRSLVSAVLARGDPTEPEEIGLLAAMLASHRDQDQSIRLPAALDEEAMTQLVEALLRWIPALVASGDSKRVQMAELARAIGSLGDSRLSGGLNHLLSEELVRWEAARAQFAAGGYRDQNSDARHSWTNWYRRAFVAIGDEHAEHLLIQRLHHPDFGVEAASALAELWQLHNPITTPSRLGRSFLREMAVRRGLRLSERPPAPAASAILDAVNLLLDGDESQRLRGFRLATAAFRIPCGDTRDLVDRLLAIQAPLNLSYDLHMALALAGERLRGDQIQTSIDALVAESASKPWILGNNHENYYRWLQLFAFSERPEAMLEHVSSLEAPHLREPYRLRGLMAALGASNEPNVEEVLFRFVAMIPSLVLQYEWLSALRTRGTESSGRGLLGLLLENATAQFRQHDADPPAAYLAQLARDHREFRDEILRILEHLDPDMPNVVIVERAVAMVEDNDSLVSLVRYHARAGRPADILYSTLKDRVISQQPWTQSPGAMLLLPRPAQDLRKRLFALCSADTAEAPVAARCLAMIDEIRDQYGFPESEPRHPDIATCLPWPQVRSGT